MKIACMKTAVLGIAGVGFAAWVNFAAGASFAAAQTPQSHAWTGTITDTMCAQSHQSNIEHARENSGKTMTAKECTVGCVTRRGQKYVLVSNGKIYQIANQDYAGLAGYAAETVKLTGSLAGDTIKVSQIAATAKRAGK
jgi:hypothetical protein